MKIDFHNEFTFYHFLILSVILLIVDIFILKFRKINWRDLLNWKILLLALVVTLLGLFYSELNFEKDWKIISYGFPKGFYFEKISLGKQIFMKFTITRFDYMNFIQNFILYFLLINIFQVFNFKKSK